MIRHLKLAAALATTTAVMALAPAQVLAWSNACNQCFGGCLDAYMADGGHGAETRFSQCVNSCVDDNGYACQIAPGG